MSTCIETLAEDPNSWSSIVDAYLKEEEEEIPIFIPIQYEPNEPNDIGNKNEESTVEKNKNKKNRKRPRKNKEEWTVVKKKVKKPKKENTTLILKNLPYYSTFKEDLMYFFKSYGHIQYIDILTRKDGNCTGIAFVKFKKKECSDKALEELNKFTYSGRTISIKYAEERKK
uniref:RNA recognition motif protein n=1 Tax=Pithovirus LCPAC302 TaxID=2506593 RepID=A0A481Z7Q2_9VIRU|nr:MAG: RNA recognition motif protein [Pithovirus LCPAC302]